MEYLLGELSEGEQERVEEHFFNDRAVSDLLVVVEDELIDQYVNDRLTPARRQQFEDYFLRSPARRERVEFARAWKEYVARAERPAATPAEGYYRIKKPLIWLPLAAMILLAVGVGWTVVGNLRLRNQLEALQTAQTADEEIKQDLRRELADEKARNATLTDELAQSKPNTTPGQVKSEKFEAPTPDRNALVWMTLVAGITREVGELPTLSLPGSAKRVLLKLPVKTDTYKSYSATLKTVDGKTVWSRDGLKDRAKAADTLLTLTIPARRLDSGDYILTLNGITSTGEIEPVSEYPFRVLLVSPHFLPIRKE